MQILETYLGDTGSTINASFTQADGITAFDLTGATLTMKMMSAEGEVKVASGSWVIDNAAAGQAHYPYVANDVNETGLWTLYVVATIGGKPQHLTPFQVEIKYAP